jgi:hypothetical protein
MSALKVGLLPYLKSRGQMKVCVRPSGQDWTVYQPSAMSGDGDTGRCTGSPACRARSLYCRWRAPGHA